jgi:hypothetical protein
MKVLQCDRNLGEPLQSQCLWDGTLIDSRLHSLAFDMLDYNALPIPVLEMLFIAHDKRMLQFRVYFVLSFVILVVILVLLSSLDQLHLLQSEYCTI